MLQTEKGLTANLPTIMQEFQEKWKKVYNRLETSPPNYEEFKRNYGQYMSNPPAGDLRPNGEQLAAVAEKGKNAQAETSGDR